MASPCVSAPMSSSSQSKIASSVAGIASTVVSERSVRVVLTDVLPNLVGKRTKRRRGEVLQLSARFDQLESSNEPLGDDAGETIGFEGWSMRVRLETRKRRSFMKAPLPLDA